MTKTREQLIEYVKARPGRSNSQLADNLRDQGVKAKDIAEARAALHQRFAPPQTTNCTTTPPAKPVLGKCVSSLLGEFDELAKVRATMKGLSRGAYLEDDEMRTTAKVPLRSWNAVKSHPTLAQFRYKLPNQRFVWMHTRDQAELTAAINLSQT